MGVTVDSSFVVDMLKGRSEALAKSRELDGRGETLYLSTPVIYEVTTGLLRNASRIQTSAFRALAQAFTVLPFDEPAADRGAEIRAELSRAGKTVSHIDTMIAAIALVGGHSLVTRNGDFKVVAQVARLRVESY